MRRRQRRYIGFRFIVPDWVWSPVMMLIGFVVPTVYQACEKNVTLAEWFADSGNQIGLEVFLIVWITLSTCHCFLHGKK